MSSNEWKYVKVKDIAEIIFSGGTPSTKKAEFWNGKINWLSSGETRSKFIYNTEKKITQEGVDNSSTKLAKKKDIVIASAGQGFTRGQTSMCLIDTYINQSLICIRAKKDVIDPYYLFYNISSRYAELRQISDGHSIRGSLTTKIISDLNISLPIIKEQIKIGETLFAIDEKIEINNKINKKLEEMAQAIFKQWFVDFEFPNEDGKPYKSSGGEMVESELGMIPKGWEVILLDEIVDTFNGYSYKGKELSESEDAMITIKNFDRNGGYKMDGLKEIVISDKVKPHHFVEVNDIIVAHTDLTQGAEIIGNPIMIFSKGSYEKLIMSMDTVKVKSKIKEMNNELLYFILKDYRFKQYALGYVNGTTVLHLSKSTIPQYKIALPYDKSIMNQLGDNLSPIMSKIANNFKENEKLIMLRDALLPKLMSGEIRVPMD